MAKKAEKKIIIHKKSGQPDFVTTLSAPVSEEEERHPVRAMQKINPWKEHKSGLRITPKTPKLS